MKENSTISVLSQPASSLVLPEQLAQQGADAVRELLAEAAAANTTRSYTSALRYWAGWHAARYGIELTLPVAEGAARRHQCLFSPRNTRAWAAVASTRINRFQKDLIW